LVQWDREKGLPVDDTDLTLKRKEAIMQEIAFAMHTGRIGGEFGGKEATSREIIPIIEEKLRQFRLPTENARSLFRKLVDRSGVIVSVEQYTDRLSFSHLTFQEFYTAKYVFENQLSVLTHFMDESFEKLTGWWREVVLLYVSMVRDSSKLIREMCEPTLVDLDDLANRRLQVAAQCLLQAVAIQDETVERAILQNLLDIRLGVRDSTSVDPNCPGELRTYLLGFANTRSFSEHALRFAVKELKEDVGLDSLVARLLQLGKSSDSDVAEASLRALRDLADADDLTKTLPLGDIIELFEQPSEQVRMEALHLVCTQDDLLARRALLDEVISFALEDKWENDAWYLKYGFRVSPGFEEGALLRFEAGILLGLFEKACLKLIRQLPKVPYENESDKQWVERALWKTFSNQAESSERRIFPIPITEFQGAIAASMVLISNEKESHSFAAEFLEMLQTGSESDRLLAIEVLSQLLQEMEIEGAVEELMLALRSPHERVRLAALKALETMDLSSSQMEQTVSILETGLQSFPLLRRVLMYLDKAFTGKGQIGVDFGEKQSIIRALTKLNTRRTPQELEKLLLTFMDERKGRQVRAGMEALGSEFDHKLDPEIMSRLKQIRRNLAALQDSRTYLLRSLANLAARRSDMEDKRQAAELVLEEIKRAESDDWFRGALQALRDLKLDSAAIPKGMRRRVLALLEHKDWGIADAAFEVAVQYKMI